MAHRHIRVAFAAALAVAYLFQPVTASDKFPDTPAGKFVAADRVLVIGHRGNAAFAPENTLVSFQSATSSSARLKRPNRKRLRSRNTFRHKKRGHEGPLHTLRYRLSTDPSAA